MNCVLKVLARGERRVAVAILACCLVALTTHSAWTDEARSPKDSSEGSQPTQVQTEATLGDTSQRPARLILPRQAKNEGKRPMVVLLHGLGSSSENMAQYFRAEAYADALDVAFLVPEGTKDGKGRAFWNATDACCDYDKTGVDDLSYLSDLVAEATREHGVDPDRVYFIGHSNGGFMSYRLACDADFKVAGIASLAGAMPTPEDCQAKQHPVVVQLHSRSDAVVPYEGSAKSGRVFPSAPELAEFWAVANGCTTGPLEAGPFNFAGGAEKESVVHTYAECSDGGEVSLVTMEDTKHSPRVRPAMIEFVFRQFGLVANP